MMLVNLAVAGSGRTGSSTPAGGAVSAGAGVDADTDAHAYAHNHRSVDNVHVRKRFTDRKFGFDHALGQQRVVCA